MNEQELQDKAAINISQKDFIKKVKDKVVLEFSDISNITAKDLKAEKKVIAEFFPDFMWTDVWEELLVSVAKDYETAGYSLEFVYKELYLLGTGAISFMFLSRLIEVNLGNTYLLFAMFLISFLVTLWQLISSFIKQKDYFLALSVLQLSKSTCRVVSIDKFRHSNLPMQEFCNHKQFEDQI